MRIFIIVTAAVLVVVSCGMTSQFGLGFWEGQRNLGNLDYTSPFYFSVRIVSVLEGGAYFQWDAIENLGLRLQFAYLKGSHISITSGGFFNERKFELSGFPLQFNVLPTIRAGNRFILRTGGGLSYLKLSAKGNYDSTSLPRHEIKGLGGQFLFVAEGRLNKKVGLEAQYERGTANLSYNFTWTPPYSYQPSADRGTFGVVTEAYRLGLAFHF